MYLQILEVSRRDDLAKYVKANAELLEAIRKNFPSVIYWIKSPNTFFAWAGSNLGPHCDTTRDDANDASLPASA